MKKILLNLGVAAASAVLLTGCLEETVPTSIVTESALQSSSKASEATLQGVPGQMKRYNILGRSFHWDFGQPAMMMVRDLLTGDYCHYQSGYDHFSPWQRNQSQGQDYVYCQVMWNTYYKQILASNNAIALLPADADDANILAYRGQALAMRASFYLDLARMYEWLPNDATESINADGNDIAGLTVPIVTEQTTQAEAQHNPRASHEDMAAFILSDLDEAESIINKAPRTSKQVPDLAVVYGLKARYYMWEENYPKAAEYARLAITANGGESTITTQTQWTDRSTGFNTLDTPSWMWGVQYASEESAVLTGLINWASWQCPETTFGYAGSDAGTFPMIDASLYTSMNDTDFRKLSYKAPAGSALESKVQFIDADIADKMLPYTGVKFRPGQANTSDPNTACAVAVPMMRVEEMFLIEAEATAQTSPAAGKELLEKFVNGYRDASYVCKATDKDGVVDACFQQKRMELWGEGLIFFDIKRLNKSVTRAYQGSNWEQLYQFNTNGRPAWTNLVITRQESESNTALVGYNNPDYSGCY